MEIAYRTKLGFSNIKLNYNNQDAVIVVDKPDYKIGILAYGSGSGANSEVGAQLGLSS